MHAHDFSPPSFSPPFPTFSSFTETVIISIKPEKGDPRLMQRLLFDLYVGEDQEMWYLDNRIPCLGEVRGRIVMLSRFGRSDEQPGGIHPPIWPNNLKGT